MLSFSPLYTDGLFHCYILDEAFSHFRGVRSILSLLFLMKILEVNSVDFDQMLHYVASDLSLHCLPLTYLRGSSKNGLRIDTILKVF